MVDLIKMKYWWCSDLNNTCMPLIISVSTGEQINIWDCHDSYKMPLILCSLFFIRCDFKMTHHSLLCLFALVTMYGHDGALSQAPSYGERGSDLGIQVFQQVVRSKPLENVVLSPHGVASILGMLLPGAHGETRKQVLNALRYKKNGKDSFLQYWSLSIGVW